MVEPPQKNMCQIEFIFPKREVLCEHLPGKEYWNHTANYLPTDLILWNMLRLTNSSSLIYKNMLKPLIIIYTLGPA